MTKRRGTGEGGVHKRSDGRWEARYEAGSKANGMRIRRSVYGRTKAEVLEQLREQRERLAQGLKPSDRRRTTGDYLRWWLDNVLPGTVSAGTEATYRSQVERYLIPALGHVRIAELKPAHVTEMLRRMERGELSSAPGRPLSAQTRAQARKVLARALRRAEVEELVHRNVARLAEGPRIERSEPRSLGVDQARTLLVALTNHRLGVAFGLQLALGLRRGEVLGLCWEDVDLGDEPAVRVRRQLQRRAGLGLVLAELKTRQSRRDLDLPSQMAAALRAWRATQASERLAAGPSWQDRDGLVFTTPIGTPVDPDNYRHRFDELTVACGLGHWRTHELRHSAASILFDQGVPMKLISEMLGHSSERVTSETYVHTERAQRSRVAAAMAKALYPPATTPLPGGQPTTGGQIGGQDGLLVSTSGA